MCLMGNWLAIALLGIWSCIFWFTKFSVQPQLAIWLCYSKDLHINLLLTSAEYKIESKQVLASKSTRLRVDKVVTMIVEWTNQMNKVGSI